MHEHTFPIWYFSPIQVPIELPRTVFPIAIPANGWPYKFRSRNTTGSSFSTRFWPFVLSTTYPNIWTFWFLGILSNLGASSNFTWKYADTASAACSSQAGNLATTSIIFAAVIWEADEPCSVKTAQASESSFTMSPPEHDSAFVLLQFWF